MLANRLAKIDRQGRVVLPIQWQKLPAVFAGWDMEEKCICLFRSAGDVILNRLPLDAKGRIIIPVNLRRLLETSEVFLIAFPDEIRLVENK